MNVSKCGELDNFAKALREEGKLKTGEVEESKIDCPLWAGVEEAAAVVEVGVVGGLFCDFCCLGSIRLLALVNQLLIWLRVSTVWTASADFSSSVGYG